MLIGHNQRSRNEESNYSSNFRCDRILWHGNGIRQLSYIRGESRFSDHRPVCSTFLVDVVINSSGSKKGNMKIEVEELLPTN